MDVPKRIWIEQVAEDARALPESLKVWLGRVISNYTCNSENDLGPELPALGHNIFE